MGGCLSGRVLERQGYLSRMVEIGHELRVLKQGDRLLFLCIQYYRQDVLKLTYT